MAQEKVVGGGSAVLTEEFAVLAKSYMAKNPSDRIDVIMEAMSTNGGVEGVKAGRLTIGIITRTRSIRRVAHQTTTACAA